MGRGLLSFRCQLNLSSPVHRVTQLKPECVLEMLKLSSKVNECKPLRVGDAAGRVEAGGAGVGDGAVGRGLHSSTFRLNVSAFCEIGGACRGCLGGCLGGF